MSVSLLLAQYRWQPTMGDPSVIGWVTVAAYAAVAWMAVSTARQTPANDLARRGRRTLWLVVAGLMAFLCLNKQLDLQTLLTDFGRFLAVRTGWYEQRRGLQELFVLGILGISGLGGAWFMWRFRAFWTRHKLLTFGLQLLLTFIVIRAISFHHFDVINQSRFFGVRLNSMLELGGILLVGLAAARAWREGPPKARLRAAGAAPVGTRPVKLEFVASGDLAQEQVRDLTALLNALNRTKGR